MAKFWEPKKVKTRLGLTIGMAASAKLHHCFLQHLLRVLGDFDCQRELVFAPPERILAGQALLDSLPNRPWQIVDQGDGDLGRRMSRWFSRSFGSPDARSVLIGADCPLLEQRNIDEAFKKLDQHDVVLGPAVDGGYYLIGMKNVGSHLNELLPTLFNDMTWSRDDVYDVTARRLLDTDWSFKSLEPKEDVDTIDELQNLMGWLKSNDQGNHHQELANQIHAILREYRA